MKSFSITLESDPGCHCVGDRVLVKLKEAYIAYAACESGVIEGEVTTFAKFPNGCYTQKVKAWDACKGAYVILDQQVNRYTYTYTISYDDTEQVVPAETLILSDWVESICCMSCADSIILDAIGGLCGVTGGGEDFLTIEEDVSACGRTIDFTSGGALVHSLNLPDRRRITHVAHGFGSAGEIFALKPGAVAGTYELAQGDAALNVASHLAGGVDADTYDLLSEGFFIFEAHPFVAGVHYALSHTTPGAFLPVSNIPRTAYLQQTFRAETADCLYLSLQEAQSPDTCCNTITKVAHGFEVGSIVAQIGGIWVLAIANTPGAVIVTEVLDADTFVVGLGACLQDIEGVVASESYVVSPTTPGAIVPFYTLSHDTHQAHKPVGVGLAEGCLLVNMAPAHTYLCNCGLGDMPDGPEPEPIMIFETSFSEFDVEDVETCGYDSGALAVNYTETVGRDPYWSDVVVGTDTGNCSFQSTIPIGLAEGTGHQALYYDSTDHDCIGFSIDVGVSELTLVTNWLLFTLRGSDVGGTFAPDGVNVTFFMEDDEFTVQSTNASGGPLLTITENIPVSLLANTWYRISGQIILNTVGMADGYMSLKIQILDGDLVTGSLGLVLGTIVDEAYPALTFRDTVRGINTYMINGYVVGNTDPAEIFFLADNLEIQEC